jgi:hypothetical protein
MINCIACDDEIKGSNSLNFGMGKISDGSSICKSCYKLISDADFKFGTNLKKHSKDEVLTLIKSNYGDIKKVKTQIKNLNLDNSVLKQKEIKELPRIISDNENIDDIVYGLYNNGIGILVSTNQRLIFIDKGTFGGLKVEDFPLNKISSIQYETGFLTGKLKIHTSGNVAVIDSVAKNKVRSFAESVRSKIESKNEQVTISETSNSNISVLDQLEKLAKLKESGILNEEEFNQQKAKILSQ